MTNRIVSPFSGIPTEPLDGTAASSYPYLVVRMMSSVYQREPIALLVGEPAVQIGHRISFVQHPDPLTKDGAINASCRALLLKGVLAAARNTGHRMCVVWRRSNCSYVERDGSVAESEEVPSGGVALPSGIAFDKRVSLKAAKCP